MKITQELTDTVNANMAAHLKDNPCRGLVVGLSGVVVQTQVAWIMGRSPNSQNRRYVIGQDDLGGQLLRTEAADPSKVEDPRLIIYNVMRGKVMDGGVIGPQIVSNGNQTDTIIQGLNTIIGHGPSIFFRAMRLRYCEPDAPTFTPRITAYQEPTEPHLVYLTVSRADPLAKVHWMQTAAESGLKRDDFKKPGMKDSEVTDAFNRAIGEQAGLDYLRFPTQHDEFVRTVQPGFGYCLTTYMSGSQKLPSFAGEPLLVPMGNSLESTMALFWSSLDNGPEGKNWKVALAGKEITPQNVTYREPINTRAKVGSE